MSLKENIRRLWLDLRLPIRNAVVAAALMAVATLFLPNWYLSEVRVLPSPGQGQSGIQGIAATLGLGLSDYGQDPTANYEDILNSRWLGEQLLRETYSFHQASWRFGVLQAHKETLLEYLKADDLDQGMRALRGILSVKKDLKSGLITVSAETRSPELSREIAQRSTTLLGQFLSEKTQTRGGERAKYASDRLVEVREEYDRAEAAFKAFLEVNRSYEVSADPGVRLKGARLEMELALKKQVLSTVALSREQALLDAKNDTPVLNILDTGNLPQEKDKPSRSFPVVAAFLLVGLATLIRLHWQWVKASVLSGDSA